MPTIDENTLKRMRGEALERAITVAREAINEEARTVELAFASDAPVERWFGTEILDVKPDSIRSEYLDAGAAVLVNHDWRDQVGVVESWRVDKDGVARAVVRFGTGDRASEIFRDIVDGIRRHVSVGYRIHEAVLEKQSDDGDTYRITDWEPFEVSIVSVPADISVGVGRAKTESAAADNQEGAALPETITRKEVIMPDTKTTAAPASAQVDEAAIRQKALQEERDRVNTITHAAERARTMLGDKAEQLAREAIEKGQSVEEFREALTEAMLEKGREVRSPIGLSDKEAAGFRIMHALRGAATEKWDGMEFEREVCEATRQKLGNLGLRNHGVAIPTDVLSRAVDTTVGASTIQTDVLAQSFIELLRAKMKVRQMGATVLGGLEGNVSIPRQTGAATASWVAEGVAPTQTSQAFDAVGLAPKGVAASTQLTMQMLLQSSLDIEALIRTDLATVIALAIDAAAINGSGAQAQPLGILNTPGVGSVTVGGAALTNLDPLIDLETLVADADADEESMAYLTNSRVVGQLKKLKTSTGEYVWENDNGDVPGYVGRVNGYGVTRSNQVPKTLGAGTNLSAAIFGAWRNLLIGEWGALILNVETVQANPGLLNVNALQFVDCGVRHPEAFAAITDILA